MREQNPIAAALAEPFEPREVKFKPQSVKNNRCLAMPYIDARLVQDRLDEVVGVENWCDRYTILNDGSVVCTLAVLIGDRWVKKSDVGSPSEQPDGGDRLKAAFSDALKRAAVKFGIGRYLYRLPAQWVDYDSTKKQIVQPPQLPPWALPKTAPQTQPQQKSGQPKPAQPAQKPSAQPAQKPSAPHSPAFAAMLKDLRNSGTAVDSLRTQWETIYEAHEDGRITDAEYATAKQLKDELKAKLPAPQTQK